MKSITELLKSYWQTLTTSEPGSRFESFYNRRQDERQGSGIWQRFVFVGIGLALAAAGVVFLALPGPGLLVIALGLALMASEFLFMARILDRLELTLRALAEKLLGWWQKLRPYQRALSMLVAGLMVVAAAGFLYEWLM